MKTREKIPTCLYFGSLKGDGHCLYGHDGFSFWNGDVARPGGTHIDGSLAPRKVRVGSKSYYNLEKPSQLIWTSMPEGDHARLEGDSEECPQGQFLLHILTDGFTAIQWWGRCQGDTRPGSNSTLLLSGIHSAEEVIAAGKRHFPKVFERLEMNHVQLVDVTDNGKPLIDIEPTRAPMTMVLRGEHALMFKERNQRLVTSTGFGDIWECTCGKLFESESGQMSERGRAHVYENFVLRKTCVTDEHTCDTLADECKACEGTELLKSLP
jgi:hypothetical protein